MKFIDETVITVKAAMVDQGVRALEERNIYLSVDQMGVMVVMAAL